MGADGTPTLRVDRILDEAIIAAADDAGIGVISEESGRRDGERPLWAYVDPLDGSRNATRDLPFFCTSIAIADKPGHDGLQSGVVRHLVSGREFAATAGGPFTVDGATPKPRPFDPEEVMVAVIADSAEEEIKAEQGRRGHHLRDLGSAALELAYVATGALDAMLVRREWLRNIDIAAGIVLVDAVGGSCTDPHGGPVRIGFDVQDRIGIVAARTPQAMEAVA